MKPEPEPVSCDFDPASITVSQAMAHIARTVVPVADTETLDLHSALGRVAAQEVVSTSDVPNHTNSAMDGYAVCGEELPDQGSATFEMVGESFAGSAFHGTVESGQCVRIMTGAVMPAGTDSVVMQERVDRAGNTITIHAGEQKAANVRYAGEDIQVGDVVIPAGTRLGASHLGLLASLGRPEVTVYRKPRIAFFSNGDELRSMGAPLALGEVYDSNRYTLYAMLHDLGVEQVDLGIVRDDRDAIAKAIQSAAGQADLVITTAGASVGDADYIREILTRLGQVSFWKVAIKPGRPLSFGRLGNSLFFGLPGNPVSVMVTFQVFLEPAIKQLSGERFDVPTVLKMRTLTALKKRSGRMEYQRGVMSLNENGETVVRSSGEQGSGILRSMSQANCFIILPDESDGVSAGEWVEVQPFTQ
ncbi:MAG: molybdopterin molybdotransferase MoeA [Gammaproteobacteria bacterium]|nr:molybdopterin molybdotransferase MoeA [Gammaproteobacteria bacterium]